MKENTTTTTTENYQKSSEGGDFSFFIEHDIFICLL